MQSQSLIKKIGIVSRSHLGIERQNQEDNHYYSTDIRDAESWNFYSESVADEKAESLLLLVADGMGGLEMGEQASEIARQTTRSYCFENAQAIIDGDNLQELFNILFAKINSEILAFSEKEGKSGELGTTLIIAFIRNQKAHIFWIGDSRCYLIRKGILKPVTKDHSYVQELVDSGKITYEQSFYHPESNIITKYMGDPKNTPVPSYTTLEIEKGDILLLCSDGLNGMLMDSEIQEHFYNNDNLVSICQKLIDSANNAGGYDNNTVILAAFGDFAKHIPSKPPAEDSSQLNNLSSEEKKTVETKIVYKLNRKNAFLFFALGCILTALSFLAYDYFFSEKKVSENTEHTDIEEGIDDAHIIENDPSADESNINTLENETSEETKNSLEINETKRGEANETGVLILKESTIQLLHELIDLINKYPTDSSYAGQIEYIKQHTVSGGGATASYKDKNQLESVFKSKTKDLADKAIYNEKIKELEKDINENY